MNLRSTQPAPFHPVARSLAVLWLVLGLFAGCSKSPATETPSTTAQTASVVEAAIAREEPAPQQVSAPVVRDVAQVKLPEPVYRPSDDRPRHDAARAAKAGIQRTASPRLELFYDIEPAAALPLPEFIDQVYPVWIKQFGPLLPDREGSELQMTGYLMADQPRFEAAGLLPETLPPFPFGRHRGLQFWMRDQRTDYYRAHLLIHEATHSFMTRLTIRRLPHWYLEGMAEFFGTHTRREDGKIQFGAFPEDPAAFPEWGRIELIDREIRAGRPLTLKQVGDLGEREFSTSFTVPYAWSWGLCIFLDRHPRYRDRFHDLGRHLDDDRFSRLFYGRYDEDLALLACEWDQFIRRLVYGFDIERNAFTLAPLRTWTDAVELDVAADRGWQSTGLPVVAGDVIEIAAAGEVTLKQRSPPWVSEPQGITLRYSGGQPLGTLLAGVVPDASTLAEPATAQMEVTPIGRGTQLRVTRAGTLFLRVNDLGNSLADNTGAYQVRLCRLSSASQNP